MKIFVIQKNKILRNISASHHKIPEATNSSNELSLNEFNYIRNRDKLIEMIQIRLVSKFKLYVLKHIYCFIVARIHLNIYLLYIFLIIPFFSCQKNRKYWEICKRLNYDVKIWNITTMKKRASDWNVQFKSLVIIMSSI